MDYYAGERAKAEHHPGATRKGCEYNHRVIAHPSGTSSSGYGCLATGGHCITSKCRIIKEGKDNE